MRHERIIAAFESVDRGERAGRMVWYSGAPVYRYDWFSDTEYMLKLSLKAGDVNLDRMAGAALLKDHYRSIDNQVGVIEKAWIEGGKGMAEYRLAETKDVDVVAKKIADGIIRNVSMEAVVVETRDVTPKGSKIKEFLAVDWYPVAVALVPVPADSKAKLFSEEESEHLWLPDGLYTHKFSEAGAASEEVEHADNSALLAALLCRR